MLGTGLQFGRGHGEDRFYDPLKARRNQHHYPPQNQNQNQFRKSNNKTTSTTTNLVSIKGKSAVFDNLEQQNHIVDEVSIPATIPSPAPASPESVQVQAQPQVQVPAGLSNLDRFLESTTPSIPAQYISTTRMRGLRTCDVEYQPYFMLDDLWESFKEWSAYGAGVPLVLNDCDSVVQYYVPYLSGVQIYVDSTRLPNSRRPGDDNDYFRDSSSDGSSDSDFETRSKYSTDAALGADRLSLRDSHMSLQENSSSDDSETGASRGHLLFEYLERNPPYSREPLADKILELARQFPDLKTLRSCDLLESSWISVAWYPIYRIPTGPTLKDLDACFLTFYPLSTPMRGTGNMQSQTITYPNGADGVHKMSLPIFGLASYKLKGSMWIPSGGSECHQSNSLLQAADSWLRVLQVNHPDFQFFASHGTIRR